MVKKSKSKVNTNNKNLAYSNDTNFIRNFLILFTIVFVIIVGVYFATKALVDSREVPADDSVTTGKVNYDLTSVGTILNRPYDEYFVMVYDAEDADAIYYSALITNYQQKKDALKLYFCDLSNSLNADFISADGKSNPKAKTIEDLKFGRVTLLKIKKGKIDKYIEDLNSIKDTLQ